MSKKIRDTVHSRVGAPSKRPSKSSLMAASARWSGRTDSINLSSRDYLSSLSRCLVVLRTLNSAQRQMTLSEVACETAYSRAAVRRILLTLVHEGYAVLKDGFFDLTPQVLELGYTGVTSKGIWDIARPFMDGLSKAVQESVSAAVLDEANVVCVGGAQYHRAISVGVTVGARFPAAWTATGRVLLAALPEEASATLIQNMPENLLTDRAVTDPADLLGILADVRSKGWCLVDQEMEIGLLSVAVPVHNNVGSLIGAINVCTPSVRMTPSEMVEEILPELQKAVVRISLAIKR